MSTTTARSSLHSLNSKSINMSQNEILNLSVQALDWESTSESGSVSDVDEDYDVFDYLDDEDSCHDNTGDYDAEDSSFTGSFRWTDRTKVSDELPELIRRRQSKDVLDETRDKDGSNANLTTTTTISTSTELGGRISRLTSSPTNSPRSTLGEFLQTTGRGTKPPKSVPLTTDEAGFIDDLSLDDTICTVEDEIEFMCVVMENTTM